MKKAWITKWALTQGILEVKVEEHLTYWGSLRAEGFVRTFYRKEWCDTREAAIQKAEEMRQRKIKLLERQLAKLRAMKFE